MGHDLAPGRHAVDQGEDQPAQRVGLVAILPGQQLDAQLLLQLLEIDPAVGLDRAVRRARPAAAGRRLSCSSSSSPTISSTRSSMVTRPSVPPNSSTTTAIRLRVTRISSSRSSTRIEGGTTSRGRMTCSTREALAVAPERQQVLDVDDAQHVVEIARGRRPAASGSAACIVLTTSRSELVASHALDVGARHHDVVDPQLAEAQRVADELALLLAERRGALLLGLGDQLLQRVAQAAGLGLAAPGELAHPPHEAFEQGRLHRLALGQLLHGAASAAVGVGDAQPRQQLDLPAPPCAPPRRRSRGRSPADAACRARADGSDGRLSGVPSAAASRCMVSRATTTSPRRRGAPGHRCRGRPRPGTTARWSPGPGRESPGSGRRTRASSASTMPTSTAARRSPPRARARPRPRADRAVRDR